MKNTLCIACLSWRKPHIWKRTLKTYKKNGLLDYADEKVVYFNECTVADEKVAKEYNFTPMGSDKNQGIGRAFKTMALNTKSRYILFLENDFTLIESEKVMRAQLDAVKILLRRHFHVVKLRHRKNHGEPLYSKGKVIKTHLLGMVHWADKLPKEVIEAKVKEQHFWWSTAQHANYTNNPACYRRDFFIKEIRPHCNGDGVALEGAIQPHWEKRSDILVAQMEGLFKHQP